LSLKKENYLCNPVILLAPPEEPIKSSPRMLRSSNQIPPPKKPTKPPTTSQLRISIPHLPLVIFSVGVDVLSIIIYHSSDLLLHLLLLLPPWRWEEAIIISNYQSTTSPVPLSQHPSFL
jgi:hypothetical protein